MTRNFVFPASLLLFTTFCFNVIPTESQFTCPAESERIDCLPEGFPTLSGCESRRCYYCAPEPENPLGAPKCVLPPSYGYLSQGPPEDTPNGIRFYLRRASNITYFGGDAENLILDFEFQADYRLRVKLTDGLPRFEVPIKIIPPAGANSNLLYTVDYSNDPTFSFKIIRKATGTILFDSSLGGLTFSDQFIQISTRLPSKDLYGIGYAFILASTRRFTAFKSSNISKEPLGNAPQYGVHPTYTVLEEDGNAHTVLFYNSNAQEFVVLPTPGLVYRTIGGILDMYIFMGPTSLQTAQQYTEAVGRAPIPPYWSLGFQLCRIGYYTLENMKAVVERIASYGIPQDVQYGDGDTKDRSQDFTIAQDRFLLLPEFVREIKERGIKYVTILNPFTSTGNPPGQYRPLDLGNEMNVWTRKPDGSPSRGKVWPPDAVLYADYSKNVTKDWWIILCSEFHTILEFDGLWIDMNEPSNLFKHEVGEYCTPNKYNSPPYVPNIPGHSLTAQTVCMDHETDAGLHYDVHSLIGHFQSEHTAAAVEATRPDKRSFVLTRSTFVGSGKYVAHWLGDNFSKWTDMRYSIIGILQFNLFGIPFVGADICGFIGNTTAELCQRWMELGAFYPFARNHNGAALEQDPGFFGPAVAESSRKALEIRYNLLPYLYTLFYFHNTKGNTVARALWAEFPMDTVARSLDTQFLWGEGFMISPVLEEGATTVEIYFPDARWFNYYDGTEVNPDRPVGHGIYQTVAAPLDFINLHMRGGTIYPSQEPGLNTQESRENQLELIIALDDEEKAEGYLYYDDGEVKAPVETGHYFLTKYIFENGSLTTIPQHEGYKEMGHKILNSIRIFGGPAGSWINAEVQEQMGSEYTVRVTRSVLRSTSGEMRLQNLGLNPTKQYKIQFSG